MLVIGAQGHAKEILQIFEEAADGRRIVFYDNINADTLLFGRFPILNSPEQAALEFRTDDQFVLGIGGSDTRYKLMMQFASMGGTASSVISKSADIGSFDVNLGVGINIMKQVFISNSVSIGEGSLINFGCNIHHDVSIGKYCELSPKCQVLGRSQVGDFCSIGAGAIILPKLRVGNNVIIGAGAVVTRDIDNNCVVAGVPARKLRDL